MLRSPFVMSRTIMSCWPSQSAAVNSWKTLNLAHIRPAATPPPIISRDITLSCAVSNFQQIHNLDFTSSSSSRHKANNIKHGHKHKRKPNLSINNSRSYKTSRVRTILSVNTVSLFGCPRILGFSSTVEHAESRHLSLLPWERNEKSTRKRRRRTKIIVDDDDYEHDEYESTVSPSPYCSFFLTEWAKSGSSLLIIGGSSGSGKSVIGIHLAKLWKNQNDERMVSSQITISNARSTNNKKNSTVGYDDDDDAFQDDRTCFVPPTRDDLIRSNNIVVYLTKSDLEDEWDEIANAKSTREVRNSAAKRTIHRVIETLFRDEHKAQLVTTNRSSPRHDSSKLKNTTSRKQNVVLVIDELGSTPIFLRALASVAEALARELDEKFFGKKKNSPTASPRVAFVACGTGLAVNKSKDGSHGDTFISFLLDSYPLSLRHMLRNFKTESSREALMISERFLSRLNVDDNDYGDDNENERRTTARQSSSRRLVPALEPIELLAVDLLKNARCAAIFCLEVAFLMVMYGRPKVQHLLRFPNDWFRFELPQLLRTVIRKYIRMNSLSSFDSPINILLCCLAVVVFRLPALPTTVPEALVQPLIMPNGVGGDTSMSQSPSTTRVLDHQISLHELLSTSSGVLVDQSFTLKRGSRKTLAGTFALSSPNNSKNTHADPLLYFPQSGRYFLSRASLAKIHFFLGIDRRSYDENDLELSIGDFCFCTVVVAPYYACMKRTLIGGEDHHHCAKTGRGKSLFQTEEQMEKLISTKDDPFFSLKKELVFDKIDHNNNTTTTTMFNNYQVKYFQNEERVCASLRNDDDDDSNQLVELLEESNRWRDLDEQMKGVSSGKAVVIMKTAHDQESFANVVVAGQNKLVLIQVKSKKDGYFTEERKKVEFAKMNFGTCSTVPSSSSSSKNKKNERTLSSYPTPHQVRIFDRLVEKCRCDKNSEVKVVAFIIVTSSDAKSKHSGGAFGCSDVKPGVDLDFEEFDKTKNIRRVAKIISFDHDSCGKHTNPFRPIPVMRACCTKLLLRE